MTNSTVSITHRGGFEAGLGRLRGLLQELDKADPRAFTEALAAAASGTASGPLRGIGAGEATATGGAAPVYQGAVDAVTVLVDDAGKHIAAARESVSAAISDLEALLRGVDGADEVGVRGIGAA